MAQTVWRGHLTFGLVSFPVRLYKAARPEKVQLRRLYRPPVTPTVEAPKSIRRVAQEEPPPPEPQVYRTENRIVAPAAAPPPASRTEPEEEPDEYTPPAQELVKGFEYDKGRYVVLEDQELKALVPETSKEMQIVEFVHLAEIDPIFFETSYYVTPEEAGQRPYALLYEALRKSEYVGLGQLAMHRREHVVVLRSGPSGMIAHTMFFADEIRKEQEYHPDLSAISPRELDLANRLIETMAVPFDPSKFRDTYRERLRELIDAKVAGREVARESAAAPRTGQVIDIFDALQKSLNAIKKPAAQAPAAPATKRRTRKAG